MQSWLVLVPTSAVLLPGQLYRGLLLPAPLLSLKSGYIADGFQALAIFSTLASQTGVLILIRVPRRLCVGYGLDPSFRKDELCLIGYPIAPILRLFPLPRLSKD